jgi:flagellar biosynthesis anti-sigma factor FlgM
MKIQGKPEVPSIEKTRSAVQVAPTRAASGKEGSAAKVSLSSDGAFVASLKAAAAEQDATRAERIAETKAQIANGTLDTSVDMDQVIDGLLGDL